MKPTTFQKKLLNWFDSHGRKHLPWQINKTPYRVWVSEIMLQQTQVQTVIPYFERFMQMFPHISTLAQASVNDVLHLWTGLGYYSRARNLHKSAQMVMSHFGGKFPDTLDTLVSLPGIGPSTAGAILAISYEKQATILDGNVKRVLARVFGVEAPINEKKTESEMWELAVSLTPKIRVADYTQAMMDLGATCCTRSKPLCKTCPMTKSCVAYQHDLITMLPAKIMKKKIPTRVVTFLILKYGTKILLEKRPDKGAVWGGLYSLPELPGIVEKKEITNHCLKMYRLKIKEMLILKPFKHTFTHYHLEIHPMLIEIESKQKLLMHIENQLWYNLENPQKIGIPAALEKIIKFFN